MLKVSHAPISPIIFAGVDDFCMFHQRCRDLIVGGRVRETRVVDDDVAENDWIVCRLPASKEKVECSRLKVASFSGRRLLTCSRRQAPPMASCAS